MYPVPIGFFGSLNGRQVSTDAPGGPRCGVTDGSPSKVSIPRGGVHLRVTEQFADHREALAQSQGPGSIPAPEVVNSHVLQSGPRGCGARASAGR